MHLKKEFLSDHFSEWKFMVCYVGSEKFLFGNRNHRIVSVSPQII